MTDETREERAARWRLNEARRRVNTPAMPGEKAHTDRVWELRHLIASTPAVTMAGAQAKARAIMADMPTSEDTNADNLLAWSLARDLAAMARLQAAAGT
jgi:hypothetical protein